MMDASTFHFDESLTSIEWLTGLENHLKNAISGHVYGHGYGHSDIYHRDSVTAEAMHTGRYRNILPKTEETRNASEGITKKSRKVRKPPIAYSTLVTEALLENTRLTARQICEFMAKKYPSNFSLKEKRWQACVRNTLTLNKMFKREDFGPRPASTINRGNYWTLSDDYRIKTYTRENKHLSIPVMVNPYVINQNKHLPKPESRSALRTIVPKPYANTILTRMKRPGPAPILPKGSVFLLPSKQMTTFNDLATLAAVCNTVSSTKRSDFPQANPNDYNSHDLVRTKLQHKLISSSYAVDGDVLVANDKCLINNRQTLSALQDEQQITNGVAESPYWNQNLPCLSNQQGRVVPDANFSSPQEGRQFLSSSIEASNGNQNTHYLANHQGHIPCSTNLKRQIESRSLEKGKLQGSPTVAESNEIYSHVVTPQKALSESRIVLSPGLWSPLDSMSSSRSITNGLTWSTPLRIENYKGITTTDDKFEELNTPDLANDSLSSEWHVPTETSLSLDSSLNSFQITPLMDSNIGNLSNNLLNLTPCPTLPISSKMTRKSLNL